MLSCKVPPRPGHADVSSGMYGFVAIRVSDGAVVTWGGWAGSGGTQKLHYSTEYDASHVGYVRVWTSHWSFMAQKADGTIMPFGDRVRKSNGQTVATWPQPMMDINQCVTATTRPVCTWQDADKAETGWILCATVGEHSSHNEPPRQASECGGGPAPGNPYAIVDQMSIFYVTLSAPASVLEGYAASPALSFVLNTGGKRGVVRLTPTATGITFEPNSVDVASGQTTSATFKATATAGTAAGKASISVKLEGSASNIGKTSLTVSGANSLTVLDGIVPRRMWSRGTFEISNDGTDYHQIYGFIFIKTGGFVTRVGS